MHNPIAFTPSALIETQEPFVLFQSGILDQNFILSFAEAVMDFNPIHCDVEFARSHGFTNTAAHGMLSLSFFEQALLQSFGEQWRLSQIDGRFTKILHVGQALTGVAQVVRPSGRGEQNSYLKLKIWAQIDGGDRVLVGNAHMSRLP